jgi:Tfp pilus assembly protein PilF/spermidine synthase
VTPESSNRMLGAGWVPQATVFVSSFCIMVIELVAGRLISRHLGSSLYTWTSVIGIVLAGIALGNYVGGRLADRRRAAPTLAMLFILASAMCVTITILNNTVGEWFFLWTLPWSIRVGLHVAIVFLAPSVILGMISPVAAKAALDNSTHLGQTIGSVYAWGVIGSIAGTFLTGFYLIAAFGTGAIIWTVAGTLAVMALLFGASSLGPRIWGGILVVLLTLGVGPWAWAHKWGASLALRELIPANVLYFDESQYSRIQIVKIQDDPEIRNMLLDKLLHSSIVLADPLNLQYSYERVYSSITRTVAADRDSLNTLTVGGGGYAYPRYVDATWPRSRTEVVEIDPAVTRAAIAAFGLPEDHGLIIHHEDGRAFLNDRVDRKRQGEPIAAYDFVYMDAITDYSVPYQLTTFECVQQIHELLAEDGVFLMNMMDVFDDGLFLGSMVETMKAVFPHVDVFIDGDLIGDLRETFIVAGAKQPVDYRRTAEIYEWPAGLDRLTAEELAVLHEKCQGRQLRDDWAPVENLLGPVVRRSSRTVAATSLAQKARDELRRGDRSAAMDACERALEFAPNHPEALAVLANIHLTGGNLGRAVGLYEKVLDRHPDLFMVRLNLARAFLRQGRLDDAERVIRAAPHGDAESILALNNLGTIAASRGEYADAVRSFRRAIELKDDYLEARLNLALSLLKMNDVEAAVGELQQILAIDPQHRQARQGLEAIASVRTQ